MADQPTSRNLDVTSFNVLLDGSEISGVILVSSIEIEHALNRIPTAKIVIQDGNPSTGNFVVSDGGKFEPGTAVKINAGYQQENETVFEGIIISHGVRIKSNGESELVVKCADKALTMTVARKNKYFLDQKDSDIIGSIIGDAGLDKKVDATSVTHKEQIQYQCTDWDFVLSRAEANGLVIVTEAGKVEVIKPKVTGGEEIEVIYGTSISKTDLEVDARYALKEVKCHSWDMSQNKMVDATSSKPDDFAQGDWDGDTLAKVLGAGTFELHSTAPLPEDDLKAWADARLLKSHLSRIRGTVSFQGNSKVKVNTIIKISGLGKHFDGKGYVSSVKHTLKDGTWQTEAGLGISPDWFSETKQNILLPPAGGLLPGINGLYNGVVKQIHEDPDGETRIHVDIPVIAESGDGVWARMAHFYASSNIGAFFLPEVGDEVLLGFLAADPRYPVILGMMYSKKHEPPFTPDDKNTHKGIVTQKEMKLVFDDDKVNFWIETPNGNKLTISDENGSIIIEDENQNKLTMDSAGITMETQKDLNFKAMGKINLDSKDAITIKAAMDAKVEGMNVSAKGQVAFKAEGAMAELKGSAQTTVKGGIVMIN